MRTLGRLACLVLLVALGGLVAVPVPVHAKPRVHVVYKGQRLGSIAKRYNVTIEALCEANGIKRSDVIRPGQKLIIPGTDTEGSSPKKKESKSSKDDEKDTAEPQPPKTHRVYKGQRLGSIAKRYHVSVAAICHANGIEKSEPIHPGQVLLIPGRHDDDGDYARRLRLSGKYKNDLVDEKKTSSAPSEKASKRTKRSWEPYEKPAWKRGYVTLVGYNDTWKGYVIGPKGQILGLARQKISEVLAATGERPRISSRLIRLLAEVSDTFGGRPIRVVSGYRERSYAAASRHRTGRAIDFSIPGVPNSALRDYLRASFDNVGVGFYPNSSFVHLDVRDYDAYWIDDSGPGEAPRYRHRSKKSTAKKSERGTAKKRTDGSDDEEGKREKSVGDAPSKDDEASKDRDSAKGAKSKKRASEDESKEKSTGKAVADGNGR